MPDQLRSRSTRAQLRISCSGRKLLWLEISPQLRIHYRPVLQALFFQPAGFHWDGRCGPGGLSASDGCNRCPRWPNHAYLHLDGWYQHCDLSGGVECRQPAELHPECTAKPNRTCGGTGTFSLEATAINGFSGTVVVNLSGVNGLSASPATVTLVPGVAQQITVTATAAGDKRSDFHRGDFRDSKPELGGSHHGWPRWAKLSGQRTNRRPPAWHLCG